MVSSKKKVLSAFLSLAMIGSMVAAVPLTASADAVTATTAPAAAGVTYQVQGQTYGWQGAVSDGSLAGTVGLAKRLEAIKISLKGAPAGASISYEVQGQTYGWQAAKADGVLAGTVGQAKRLEAIKITLSGAPGYEVKYKVQGQSYGWQNWVTTANGTAIASAPIAGTVGQAKRLEAIEIIVEKTNAEIAAETAATAAVVKAEGSKAQADIDAAAAAITSVQDSATAKYLTDRLTAINVTLAVVSATEINADQIAVVFSKPVNETSAETAANYVVKAAGGVTIATTPVLQSDNKTVILTLASGLANTTGYSVTVQTVLDATYATVPTYYTSFIANDATAPTLVSAVATAKTSTTSVTLTFSEPVDTTTASILVNGSYASFTPSAANNTVTLTTSTLTAGASYPISIINVKDCAGNATVTNPLAASVAVSADTTAPNVVSAVVKGDKTLEVTFDKAIALASLTVNSTNTGNVKLLDTNLGTTAAGYLASPAYADTTDKVVDFTIKATSFSTSNPMNAIVSFSSSILDTSGNALNPVLKNIAITEDTTAPTLVSAVYENTATFGVVSSVPYATANGSIVLTYSEPVTVAAAPTFTVIDNNGTTISSPFGTAAVNEANTNQIILPLSAAVATGTTSYLVLLPSGLATDVSQSGNKSVAVNEAVNVSAGAVVSGDTTAPVVDTINSVAATNGTSGSTITYKLHEANPNFATVVNTANYLIDSKPLPTGSYVTVGTATGDTRTVTITIPAGSFTADETASGTTGGYLVVISGIKDVAGNTASTAVQNVTFDADVAPALTSGVINSDGSLTVGFSQAVKTVTVLGAANVGADLVLTVNGSTVPAVTTKPSGGSASTITGYMITDGTGADAGKYVLTVYNGDGSVFGLANATSISIATVSAPATIAANTTLGVTAAGSVTVTVK